MRERLMHMPWMAVIAIPARAQAWSLRRDMLRWVWEVPVLDLR